MSSEHSKTGWRLREPVAATGLSWLRVLAGLVVLAEVLQLIWFEQLAVASDRALAAAPIPLGVVGWIWVPALVMVIVGFHGRAAAAVNLVFTWFTFGVTSSFEYHADYSYSGLALFLILAPVFESLSIDALRRDLAAPGAALERGTATVLAAWPSAVMFVFIALVYFDSVGWKLSSPMWRAGLGVWMPASVPQSTWLPTWLLQPLLDQKPLMLTLGYLTLAFETVFIFLMWARWARPILLIVGLGLHIGIVAAFPIPLFGLVVAALYVVVVPDGWWVRIAGWLRTGARNPAPVVVDAQDPSSLRRAVLLRSFDVRGALELRLQDGPSDSEPSFESLLKKTLPGVVVGRPMVARWLARVCDGQRSAPSVRALGYGQRVTLPVVMMVVAAAVQLNLMAFAGPTGGALLRATGNAALAREMGYPVKRLSLATRRVAGLTPHPVFMDFHFKDYNHVVGIVYVAPDGSETWLPMMMEDGRVSTWASGRMWVFWTFRVVGARVDSRRLAHHLRGYTRLWAHRQGVSLERARFAVRVKKVSVPFAWEPKLLSRNTAAPWMAAGTVDWVDGSFVSRIHPNIETL